MPRGDKQAIMRYKVPKFSVDKQIKIVKILGNIDDKIKLNEMINRNLEEQAQALFKSWFIDFEPFGGSKPSDWAYGTILSLAENIICGKTPPTKVSDYYGNDIPFITIPDMHNQTYVVTTERYLSIEGANSQANKMLPKNSICVSCIGTAGLVTLVATDSQTNQQINSIIPKQDYSPYYIYLLMQTLSETINKLGQSGSTFVNLNKAHFSKIDVLIPSVSIMNLFDMSVTPMFEMILSYQNENNKLKVIRDTLLPKLMSGELDVSNIDI
jgi:type I restriction enzyme S subunit